MGSIRVAIVGVGNCSSSLVQGVEYYREADPSSRVPGLMHVQFGDYHIAMCSSSPRSTSTPRRSAATCPRRSASENNTIKIADVPPMDVTVQRGPTLDGLGKYYRETIDRVRRDPGRRRRRPQGRQGRRPRLLPARGVRGRRKFYAQAPSTRVAFVNALPVFIAGTPEWAEKFRAAGVPIVGDDIKSQIGATITHRVLTKLFEDRGVTVDRTYQLNVGGNMDFKNMLERDRLESKKISKTQSVTSQMQDKIDPRNVHIGPSDYVAWLDDRKWAFVRLEGAQLRRRPAQPRVQARGLGLPELGRHHHRRDPRGEDRQGPRHRRPDPVGVVLLHEVPAGAAPGRPRSRQARGVHRGYRGALSPHR
jgi:myo-inositol-1-phosphate synthase